MRVGSPACRVASRRHNTRHPEPPPLATLPPPLCAAGCGLPHCPPVLEMGPTSLRIRPSFRLYTWGARERDDGAGRGVG